MLAISRPFFAAIVVFALVLPCDAKAFGWSDFLELIINSNDMLSKLSDGIKKAYDTGTSIVDNQHARNISNNLLGLEESMSGTGGGPSIVLDNLEDYLSSPGRTSWGQVSNEMAGVSGALQNLINAIHESGPNIIEVSGMKLHNDLLSALSQQQNIYHQVSELPEPVTQDDRERLLRLSKELRLLHGMIGTIEESLDNFAGDFFKGDPN